MLRRSLITAIASFGLLAAACYELPPPGSDGRNQEQQDPEEEIITDPDPDPDPTPARDAGQPDPTPPRDSGTNPAPDAGEPVGETAQDLFEANVAPILQAQCALSGCHAGPGVTPIKYAAGTTVEYLTVISYTEVIGTFDKATAPIVTMVSPGPHYTAVYTAAHLASIGEWLDKEKAERNTPGTDGGTTVPPIGPGRVSAELISEWSGCMDLADWNLENVAQEWAGLGSGEGPCIRCHVNGQGSFIATDESERMFNILTTNKYFMLSYFAPNVVDIATAKMEINSSSFDRVANGLPPHNEHPQFEPINSEAMAALVRFYDKTMARKAAGTCAPARIPVQ